MPPGSVASGNERAVHIVFLLPIGEYYSTEWTGAIATVTRHLARELGQDGHRITVLTSDDGGTAFEEGTTVRLKHGPANPAAPWRRKADTAIARLRGWTWPDYGPYFRAASRAVRDLEAPPDAIVVANDPRTADRLARRGVADRVLLWLHNRLEGPEAGPLLAMSSSVDLVAVSDAVAEWTRSRYLPDAEIRVIRSGVDNELFRPRDGWLEVRDPVRVVCHGRIDPNKGHEVAADAVAALRSRGVPIELTLIGEVRVFGFGPEEVEAYRRRVDAAVASAHGTRLGWMPHAELAEELRRHDIACVLSRVDEPFGLVSLEAMASGCAIIATRMGGIPEAVGSAGALVAPDAPDEVAAVLERWVRDRDELAAMKRAAVERARSFTWAATADALVALLRS